MPVVKRVVCLANSRKLSGRCIAGKELTGGRVCGWIRPVSARRHQEVSEYERNYKDGTDPQVMDLVDIPLLEPRKEAYQQENWLLDANRYWVKAGRIERSELDRIVDPDDALWANGDSTYHGENDRVPLSVANRLQDSLRLVRVNSLTLSVFAPSEAFGNPKRRVQGRFRYGGINYRLRVTDPRYERVYLAKKDGEFELGESYLTVSLGEPFQGYCYKLIAAVIERNPRA